MRSIIVKWYASEEYYHQSDSGGDDAEADAFELEKTWNIENLKKLTYKKKSRSSQKDLKERKKLSFKLCETRK